MIDVKELDKQLGAWAKDAAWRKAVKEREDVIDRSEGVAWRPPSNERLHLAVVGLAGIEHEPKVRSTGKPMKGVTRIGVRFAIDDEARPDIHGKEFTQTFWVRKRSRAECAEFGMDYDTQTCPDAGTIKQLFSEGLGVEDAPEASWPQCFRELILTAPPVVFEAEVVRQKRRDAGKGKARSGREYTEYFRVYGAVAAESRPTGDGGHDAGGSGGDGDVERLTLGGVDWDDLSEEQEAEVLDVLERCGVLSEGEEPDEDATWEDLLASAGAAVGVGGDLGLAAGLKALRKAARAAGKAK